MELINTIQKCPVCDGLGEKYNADWNDYIQACTHSGLCGYVSHAMHQTEFFKGRGYKAIPNVIEPCDCCEGGGRVVGSITLNDYYKLPAKTASELGFSRVKKVSSGRL